MYHFVIYLSIQAFIIYSYVYVYVLLSICLSHKLCLTFSSPYCLSIIYMSTYPPNHLGIQALIHLITIHPFIHSASHHHHLHQHSIHSCIYVSTVCFFISSPVCPFSFFFLSPSLPSRSRSIFRPLLTTSVRAHAYNCICLTLYLTGWGDIYVSLQVFVYQPTSNYCSFQYETIPLISHVKFYIQSPNNQSNATQFL